MVANLYFIWVCSPSITVIFDFNSRFSVSSESICSLCCFTVGCSSIASLMDLVMVSGVVFSELYIKPLSPAVTLAVIEAEILADSKDSSCFSISLICKSRCLQTLSLLGVVFDTDPPHPPDPSQAPTLITVI